jgi:hypothetical protein
MQTRPTKLSAQGGVTRCPICGCSCFHRVPRTGLAQRTILSLFGYFPWECARCKELFLIRKRFGPIGSDQPESLN